MSKTAFIITIDTEGDDMWARPREITTRNAAYLPRFQSLCERFGFKPVYLTNYEMALSDPFVEFARAVLVRGTGEIGMHLHAWNTPPLEPLTSDDFQFQPYLIEYPERVMREKIKTVTRLLEERIGQAPVSHRAGRWAFDGRYAAILLAEGYRVDCSVTPGVDWRRNLGDPSRNGGTDYTAFPARPYFLSPFDISLPSANGLLEVPMTTRASSLYRIAPCIYRVPLLRRAANRVSPALGWLGPTQPTLRAPLDRHLADMLAVTRKMHAEGAAHLEFMLHSSELMPGGSPNFRNESDIESLYASLEILFEDLSGWCRGMTLKEFRQQFEKPARESRGLGDQPAGLAAEPSLPSA